MIFSTINVLKPDEGKVLVKDGIYTTAVLLQAGESWLGWSEISREEYLSIMQKKAEEKQ